MLFLATIGVNFYVTAEAAKPRYKSEFRSRRSNESIQYDIEIVLC
jgi:hypothetical protein